MAIGEGISKTIWHMVALCYSAQRMQTDKIACTKPVLSQVIQKCQYCTLNMVTVYFFSAGFSLAIDMTLRDAILNYFNMLYYVLIQYLYNHKFSKNMQLPITF